MAEDSHGDEPVDLTVLLPAFNEEGAIAPLVDEIRTALVEWPGSWEILVVDDASTDRTAERAEAAACRVFRRTENGGAGAARVSGICSARGSLIAMLDADGSYDPSCIPSLLSHFPAYDQVNGARTTEQGTYKVLRVSAKWILQTLAEFVSGRRIPDLNTGLKVFKKDVMLAYLWVIPPGFSCVTSMTLAFLCNGHAVKYIPVSYRKRTGRSKFHPIFDTVKYLATIVRVIMYFRPLRIFFPIGTVLLITSIIRGCYNLWNSPLGLHDSDVVLFVSAIISFVIGLLADLIVAQNRNAYSIRCRSIQYERQSTVSSHVAQL